MRFILIFSFLLAVQFTFGQSDSLIYRDGKAYKAHLVQPKETLFGISRVYSLQVSQILEANPGLTAEDLKPEMQLLIPIFSGEPKEEPVAIHEKNTQFKRRKVLKQETLFGIARQYNLGVQDLLNANPIVEQEGLKEGVELIIPVKQEPKPKQEKHKVAEVLENDVNENGNEMPAFNNDDFFYHVVERGETLYSISREYNVKVDSIIALNPSAEQVLSLGERLKIKRSWSKLQTSDVSNELTEEEIRQETNSKIDSLKNEIKNMLSAPLKAASVKVVEKAAFNVGLFLPVNLKEEEFGRTKEISLSFYQGFKLAIDSLVKEKNLLCDLYLFDSEQYDTLTNDLGFNNLDLMVGPFFKDRFKVFQQFSRNNNIPIVAPVAHERNILTNQKNTFTAIPNQMYLSSALGDFVARKHTNDNIVIFDSENIRDLDAKMTALKTLNNSLQKLGADTVAFSIFKKDRKSLEDKLRKDKFNAVVIPSNESAYVSFLLNTLMQLKGYKVKVYGLESWIRMDNLDADFKNDLKVTLACGVHYDFPERRFNSFYQSSRAKYGYDLDEFGMLGFDVGFYFGSLYLQYGKEFFKHINNSPYLNEVYLRLKPSQLGEGNGFENKSAFMLQFSDFELIQVN
jgi:LysM repeat protein